MDFRLPQPLKYSLKKKKARRKALRKDSGKLSLKNHNRNASCQTDSSESSELSNASSSKKNCRRSITEESTKGALVSNDECFPPPVKLDPNPKIYPNSVYHYCTPARRKEKENYLLHRLEVIVSNRNTSGLLIASANLCSLPVNEAEMIKNGSPLLKQTKEKDGSHSIHFSDDDSDVISETDDIVHSEINCKNKKFPDTLSAHSDCSKSFLETSLVTSDAKSSLIIPIDTPRGKLTNVPCINGKNKKDAPFRSSVLHKKFNRAVENDLANTCSSDFYTRVKNRVLGLQQSNSKILDQEKSHSKEITYNAKEQKFSEDDELTEDKENVVDNVFQKENLPSFNERIKRTIIVPESEDSSISTYSPNQHVTIHNSVQLNDSGVLEKVNKENSHASVLEQESSISSFKDSDTESSNHVRSCVVRGQQIKKKFVIPDSDDSSGCESPKRTTVHVIDSSDSDSSVIELQSDNCAEEEEICIKESGETPHSVERNHSRKTLWLLENGEHKSGSSELFRRVSKRALILDSSDSIDKSSKTHEKACDIQKESEVNIQFKPGFSTLSKSKHEDIKKWLNAIPHHPEADALSACADEAQNNSEVNSKRCEDDNISLTEMEKVLDELYGKDWLGKKKSIPRIFPKKKESQIICERLTDSDDSSTPPLPASTPSKKKLYNHKINISTPQENNCITPIQGKNIFTPLTSVGKKGGINTHKTPRTAGPKCRREKECLNSGAFSSPVLTFLSSLSVGHQSARCHPEAKYFVKNFKSKKDDLTQKLFGIFNKSIFSSKLPHDMPIIWNNRLRKTAGYCYNRRVKNSEGGFTRTSRVELSSKIVDNAARLRDTLIHELCHAATWIISEVTGGHGPSWKRWTNKAMAAFPEIPPISRCHNYDIVTKYKYQCTSCHYSIGRHSKSLDIQRKCCGICGGTFELFLNAKDEAGKTVPRTPRTPNAFALFVKENYKTMKSTQDNLKHKDVMQLLSGKFAAAKLSSVPPEK